MARINPAAGGAASRPVRRDAAATHAALLDAAGELLVARGPAFVVADLARQAGTSTATAYRHFPDTFAALAAYHDRAVQDLLDALVTVPRDVPAEERFGLVCRRWVERAARWGPALVHIRAATGFLRRLRAGDPAITRLYTSLASVLAGLVDDELIPEQPMEYAVLMWITMFDERMMIDLSEELGWDEAEIARRLAHSLLRVLRHPPAD
ncbi:TetR/AcrR family transcriptional regulator [Dactylosporangium sp. AC04546]|uniref:TetR/AcrR family transcriptional regulator n=1 Tax=Dactylosporangium sp. AC04546 TaxID=2862460 RepID=UPI001EE12F26|nr:TetR/AcrR family transcriptional regulator [Dactylosporangium sp. AC04546]WVK89004.1 TetR/AcrR family transcriptional regulator [Dactylosporangium sp. AC04546]